MKNKHEILISQTKRRGYFENLDTDGRITFKWILKKIPETRWKVEKFTELAQDKSCKHS